MSTYVLATETAAARVEKDLLPMLARHGYAVHSRRTAAGRRLILVDNPVHSVIAEAQGTGGDWIVAVGPFLYRGAGGAAALSAYLAAFDPAASDGPAAPWAQTQGHFTLLIHKHGRLYVLCDGLGAHKVYHDPDKAVLSNSFLAVLATLRRARLDPDGAYIYAWTGACQAGRTFVEQVRFLDANVIAEPKAGTVTCHRMDPPVPMTADASPAAHDLPALAAANLDVLRAGVSDVARWAEGKVRLSFSGGFDSRLLLAVLDGAGVRPELYTYGRAGDDDVRIAQAIAEACGLTCRVVDKTATPPPAPGALCEVLDRALVVFDGWTNTGLFDTGADAADRPHRHDGGFVPMNGGLGEIYRNFFNLRGGGARLDDVAASFYHSFDPRWATARFDRRHYHEVIVGQLAAQLGVSTDMPTRRLEMRRAQLLYPLFRGRFWIAREAEINQRFGPMLFPYLEHACVAAAAGLSLHARNLGRLQAEMIRQAAPELAALPSAYGFAFTESPSWQFRASTAKSLYRPMWLRRHGYRLRHRQGAKDRGILGHICLEEALDTACPFTAPFFRHTEITDPDCYNRVVTMEWLAQRFAFTPN